MASVSFAVQPGDLANLRRAKNKLDNILDGQQNVIAAAATAAQRSRAGQDFAAFEAAARVVGAVVTGLQESSAGDSAANI